MSFPIFHSPQQITKSNNGKTTVKVVLNFKNDS